MVAHHNLHRPDLKVIWDPNPRSQLSQGSHFVFPELVQVDCTGTPKPFVSEG